MVTVVPCNCSPGVTRNGHVTTCPWLVSTIVSLNPGLSNFLDLQLKLLVTNSRLLTELFSIFTMAWCSLAPESSTSHDHISLRILVDSMLML
jgi:hypothetical protein